MKDGGTYEDLLFSNISVKAEHGEADRPAWPLLVSLDKRREGSAVGRIRNVTFSDLHLESRGNCLFQALAAQPIENLTLSNVVFKASGSMVSAEHSPAGGRQEEHSLRECYHHVPACFTLANVKGLTLRNVRVDSGDAEGSREVHGLVLINVQDAIVDGFANRANMDAAELAEIRLERCREVMVTGCRPRPGVKTFLETSDDANAGIVLGTNDVSEPQVRREAKKG